MKKFKLLNNLELVKFTGGSFWNSTFFKNPFKK